MKKALLVALAALFVCAPGHAANTATAQTAQNIRVGGSGPVTPYVVAIDTVDEDLTIVTPSSDKMACIVGLGVSEGTATNVTFKSGSTTLFVPELAANQGMLKPIDKGILLCTQLGEALKIQASAAISNLLIHVVQAGYLDFSK